MARKKNSGDAADVLQQLTKMAKKYSVEKNAMFQAAANQYALQQRVIDNIKRVLDEEDTLMATKEYVKGRENIYAHPLVKELPKHADSANRTAQIMLTIIETLGKEKPDSKSKLGALRNE